MSKSSFSGRSSMSSRSSLMSSFSNTSYSSILPSYSSASSSAASKASTTALTAARTANTAGKIGAGVAGMASAPFALAAQASMAIGDAVTAGLTNSEQASISDRYQKTIQSHKVGSNLVASSQRENDQIKANYANAGATIGSLFGPIGALAGYYIGRSSAPSLQTYNVDSFSGPVSPENQT